MLALAVALSVGGLFVGPVVAASVRGWPRALAVIDGAALAAVLALLLVGLLPHLVAEVGVTALAAVAVGYVGYLVAESHEHERAARLGLAVVVPALALHSFLDGAALAVAFSRSVAAIGGPFLAAALVLHRVPEGFFLASRLGRSVDGGSTFARIAFVGAATVLGALGGRELIAYTSDRAMHVVVAVGVGVILRMAATSRGCAR